MEAQNLEEARKATAASLAEFEGSVDHLVDKLEGTAEKVREVKVEVVEGFKKYSLVEFSVKMLFLSTRYLLRKMQSARNNIQ